MIATLFITFTILLLLNFPIAFCLLISSALTIFGAGIPLVSVVQRSVVATNSFTLLAIPFFMLAGNLMGAGGISARLIRFANSLVGWITGGLAHVNVLTSMLFAGITGAAVADTSAVGSMIIPAMKEDGYADDFTVAVTASSSVIGVIIPPSIPFVLYGVISGVSIGKLFLGGLVPGLIIGISQMGISYYKAKKHHYGTKHPFSLKNILLSFKDSFFAILTPVIILGGILLGVVTPTEAAVTATIYALIVGFFVYKELKLKMLPQIILESAKTTATVMFMIAGAYLFGWVITNAQLPQKIVLLVTSITESKVIITLLLILVYFACGLFLDLSAGIILLCPIFLPLVETVGIDPLFFGIITVIALGIGLVTPPVGACLFIGCKIGGISLERGAKASIPFIISFLLILVLFVLFPEIIVAVPNALIKTI
ncbi:MAG: TRAP transporter large permease [Spirochaetia bacterium]|nr:TRAP transporter large permease [Spirochaetia bacterium]